MPKKNYSLESILDLNSSNIWGADMHELAELWKQEKDEEGFSSSEEKLLNVIRLAFDVYHFNEADEREAAKYKTDEYALLERTEAKKGMAAIRKRTIRQITDLSYENIKHITAATLLELIDRNFGGGWDSISLAIKDIIETGFDISTTTLPASRLRAKGGVYERKVEDGYDVLEIAKGTWVEAIFAKKKEPQEKLRLISDSDYDEEGNRRHIENDEEEEEDREHEEETNDDDTFYESYTPEAAAKDVDEELAEL